MTVTASDLHIEKARGAVGVAEWFGPLVVGACAGALAAWLPVGHVAAHVFCVMAVYGFLRATWGSVWPSVAGAALFAVHPMQVEAAAIGARLPLAAGVGVMAIGVYCARFGKEQRGAGVKLWAAMALAEAAVVISPLMAPVAGIAFTLDYIGAARPFRKAVRDAGWMAAVTVPTAIVVHLMRAPVAMGSVAVWMRPLLPFDAAAYYLTKVALPMGIGEARSPHTVAVYFLWWTWLLPGAVGTLLFLYKVGHAYLIAAAIIFAAAVLPVCGLFPYAEQSVSTVSCGSIYLAMLGPGLALSGWLNRPRPRWGVMLVVIWLLALAGMSAHQLVMMRHAGA